MPDRPGIVTPRQVARALGVSESSVKRWCESGLIESVKTSGGHRRLPLEGVLAYLQQAGYDIRDPAVLGLPSTTGKTDRILQRSAERFLETAGEGLETAAQQLFNDLLAAGHSLAHVLDGVLLEPVRPRIDSVADPEGELKQRRARQIGVRIIQRLRQDAAGSLEAGKLRAALTASLDGAPDALEASAADLVLTAKGWRSTLLGTLLPVATLREAIDRNRPQLLWVDVPQVKDVAGLTAALVDLRSCAHSQGCRLVLSGAGLSDTLLEAVHPDADCPTCESLEAFVRAWRA